MRVCSLFCGVGGINLAFMSAGHDIVFANDVDRYACMTYRHNFGGAVLAEGDIRSHDKKDFPNFDILSPGFPKAFSFPDAVPEKERYKQVGNAVSVQVIFEILKKLKNLYKNSQKYLTIT